MRPRRYFGLGCEARAIQASLTFLDVHGGNLRPGVKIAYGGVGGEFERPA